MAFFVSILQIGNCFGNLIFLENKMAKTAEDTSPLLIENNTSNNIACNAKRCSIIVVIWFILLALFGGLTAFFLTSESNAGSSSDPLIEEDTIGPTLSPTVSPTILPTLMPTELPTESTEAPSRTPTMSPLNILWRPTSDCDPINPKFCQLPFPNNFWLNQDENWDPVSLNMTRTTIPDAINFDDIEPDKFNLLNGFSPMPVIMAYIPDLRYIIYYIHFIL